MEYYNSNMAIIIIRIVHNLYGKYSSNSFIATIKLKLMHKT